MLKNNVVVCRFCRKRKIKCNREFPCNKCIKYDQECVYGNGNGNGTKENCMMERLQWLQQKVDDLEKKVNAESGERSNDHSVIEAFNDEAFNDNDGSNEPFNDNDGSNEPFNDNRDEYLYSIPELSGLPDFDISDINFDVDSVAFLDQGGNNPTNFYYGLADKDDEIINFFTNYQPYRKMDDGLQFVGPMNVCSLEQVDPFLLEVLKHYREELNINHTKHVPCHNIQKEKNRLKKVNQSKGLMVFEDNVHDELELIHKIALILPKKRILWSLVDTFFNGFYLLTPLIDQIDFTENITRILGDDKDSNEKYCQLNYRDKLDFAILGLLLIVLRFSYVSLVFDKLPFFKHDNTWKSDPLMAQFLNNAVGSDSINIAQICLNQFDLFGPTNITIFQLTLFLKQYQMLGPEFGCGLNGFNGQMLMTILSSMAHSLGLHKDPEPLMVSERHKFLIKKLWFYVQVLDKNTSFSSGAPLKIDDFVKVPKLETDPNDKYKFINGNNRNMSIERVLLLLTMIHGDCYKEPIKMFSDYILNLNDGITILGAIEIPRRFILRRHDDDHFVKSYKEQTPTGIFYYKLARIKFWFVYNSMMITILTHVYNFHVKRQNYDKANNYLTKIFMLIFKNVLPFVQEYINGSKSSHRGLFTLAITPVFLNLNHRIIIVLLSVKIRCKIAQAFDLELNSLNHFHKLLDEVLDIFVFYIKSLSSRYYYAWEILKMINAYYNVMTKINYKDMFNYGLCLINFDNQILNQLSEIMNISFSNIELANLFSMIQPDEEPGDNEEKDTMWWLVIFLRNDMTSNLNVDVN